MKHRGQAAVGFFFFLIALVVAGVMIVNSPLPYMINHTWAYLDDLTRIFVSVTSALLFIGLLYGVLVFFRPTG